MNPYENLGEENAPKDSPLGRDPLGEDQFMDRPPRPPGVPAKKPYEDDPAEAMQSNDPYAHLGTDEYSGSKQEEARPENRSVAAQYGGNSTGRDEMLAEMLGGGSLMDELYGDQGGGTGPAAPTDDLAAMYGGGGGVPREDRKAGEVHDMTQQAGLPALQKESVSRTPLIVLAILLLLILAGVGALFLTKKTVYDRLTGEAEKISTAAYLVDLLSMPAADRDFQGYSELERAYLLTDDRIGIVHSYAVDFYNSTGVSPSGSAELFEAYQDMREYEQVDGWGNVFSILARGGSVSVRSSGEDGLLNTSDDFVYDENGLRAPGGYQDFLLLQGMSEN